jgi:ethanolamine ammonia-lyase small subunit
MSNSVVPNPWEQLRRFTNARIALGRVGDSLPTEELLQFNLAHARARDAVHEPLDSQHIAAQIAEIGFHPVLVHSAATDRAEYLRRPDLGRRLHPDSRAQLEKLRTEPKPDVLFAIADGLSALAPLRHAIPLISVMRQELNGWRVAKEVLVAQQARVALGDEMGEILQAEMIVMLIGERPGLSSPDSLGVYLTYQPRVGRTDAERNCVSNIRPEGLSYHLAAYRLRSLTAGARKLGATGVALKDESVFLPSLAETERP